MIPKRALAAAEQVRVCGHAHDRKPLEYSVPSSENIATYIESLEILLTNKDWVTALRTFCHAFEKAKTLHEFVALAKLLKYVPVALRSQQEWIDISLQIACNGREPQLILELQSDFVAEMRQHTTAYFAWAYRKLERYDDALNMLKNLETAINPGLAWRIHGECLAALKREGWHESFTRAVSFLTGRSLGICHMEYGSCCFLHQQLTTAQTQYNQAYALLKHDPYYAAWIKYNLGLVTLELGLPEAEQHFYTVQDLSNRVDAKAFRSRAWSGIGAVRRSQGQWNRAIFAYERGLQYVNKENDSDDRIAAMCGLGHTYRCEGQLNAALDLFWEALDRAEETDKIRILIAATSLQRGDIQETQKQLALLENQSQNGEAKIRLSLLNAELARRQNRRTQALEHLQEIDPKRLCVLEERHCFPELFAFAEHHGWGFSSPPNQTPLLVNVQALGVLRVEVNQQSIHLKSTSKVAELLVYLLEQHGHASTESITNALYPEKNNARRTGQALWALAKQLREALGWEDSLQDKGKAYALGQDGVIWDYDAAKQKNKSRLLEGVYSNWIQNIRQNLN
jgi:Tetratricopeptide repeat